MDIAIFGNIDSETVNAPGNVVEIDISEGTTASKVIEDGKLDVSLMPDGNVTPTVIPLGKPLLNEKVGKLLVVENDVGKASEKLNVGEDSDKPIPLGIAEDTLKSPGNEPLKLNVGRPVPTVRLITFEGIPTDVELSVAVVGSKDGIAVLNDTNNPEAPTTSSTSVLHKSL